MIYDTEYQSEKYYIGSIFTNKKFGLTCKIIAKCRPKNGGYSSKYLTEFEDGTKGEISSDQLKNGTFTFPIKFSTGNNSTNKYKTIYKRYEQLRYRCDDPHNKDFVRYGGRGIKNEFKSIYDFWFTLQKDPRIKDLLNSPGDYEIDRIDNSGNYCPDNIRIATRSENQRNKRNNFEYNLIDNDTQEVLFTGIKSDCEKFLKETLNINTALDTNVYKQEVGKYSGFSIRYEKIS